MSDGKDKIEKLKKAASSVAQNVKRIVEVKGIKIFKEEEKKSAIALCDTVLRHVPEFNKYKDFQLWGKENPYLHFGNFGNFLVERIEKIPNSDPVVERAFDFINEAYNKLDDEYIRTIFDTEIFEKLTVPDKTAAAARMYLKDAALNHFLKYLK